MGFRKLINFIGAIIAIVNMALDIVYAYQTPYQNVLLFEMTCITLVVRLIFTIGMCQYYYTVQVRNYKPSMSTQEPDDYEGDYNNKQASEKA